MPHDPTGALTAWRSIPELLRAHVAGHADALDHRPDSDTMTARELVHHIVEANVVAAGITIAALGSPGCVFDWSWMVPNGAWVERMDHGRKPIEPAIDLLGALNAYVAAQVEPLADGLARTVRLVDLPGGEPRTATVAEVLLAEVEHARDHIAGAR